MTKGLDLDIKNRSVIIIEDIIDSGQSISTYMIISVI